MLKIGNFAVYGVCKGQDMINCNFESNSLLDYRDDDSVCGCHFLKKKSLPNRH